MASIVEYILKLNGGQFQSGIDQAIGSTNALESSVTSLGSALGITFGLAGVALFTKSMVDAGSAVENAQTGLTTLLKNAEEAKQVIQNTMQDATKTPFAFEGLLMANKALIGADESAKGARETVLNLANAIAATGGGDDELQRMVVNLQQIRNTGVATAMDIKQFAFAGVNLYKVLDEAGIKHGEDSKITYEQISLALKVAHEEGGIYFNGLENMAGNTSVKISNLGDAFFQLKVQMFNDLKPAIIGTIEVMSEMISGLKSAWEWAAKNKEMIANFGKALLVAVGGLVVYKGAVIAATIYTEGLAAAFALTPFGAITAGITAIAAGYAYMTTEAERAENAVNELRNAQATDTEKELDSALEAARKKGEAEEGLTDKIVAESVKRTDALYSADVNRLDSLQSVRDKESWFSRNINPYGSGVKDEIDQTIESLNKHDSAISAANRWGNRQKKGTALASGTKPPPPTTTKTQAVGSKSITINMNIGKLGEITVNTTNLTDAGSKVKEYLQGMLIGVLNDSQLALEH